MSALALAVVEGVADAQTARNATFPEAIGSPVIGLLLMSFSLALDHFLMSEGNPLRALSLQLVQFANALGQLACESTAAMAEGDFTWTEGANHPTRQEIRDAMDTLRREMEMATDSMVQWRLEATRPEGVKLDRRIYAVILVVEEMRYYDLFPNLSGRIRFGSVRFGS